MMPQNPAAALPDWLCRVRIVLCRPSHPGNIGAAARAAKTMGITRLTLVAPDLIATPMTPQPVPFGADFRLPEESFILASGAKDVLENAHICATLQQALADTVLSYALTGRQRELTQPLQTPRSAAAEMIQAASAGGETALVFGNETFGLSIDEVVQCNRLMTIAGNPAYHSLNLAQAVMVAAYELFSQSEAASAAAPCAAHVPQSEVDGVIGHFAQVMEHAGFFERRNSARLLRRLRRLFDRSGLEREEVDILRGFLKTVEKRLAEK